MTKSLGLLVLFALLTLPLRAELEFTGIFATSKQSQFALTETTTGQTAWRKIGGRLGGAELTDYNAATDTITLRQDGALIHVRLKDSKVKSARAEIAGTLSLGRGEQIDVIRGTLLFDQENVFPLADGLICRVTPSVRPDGNIQYRASFEQTDAEGKIEKFSTPTIIARPDSPFEIRIGELGFKFAPKSSSNP